MPRDLSHALAVGDRGRARGGRRACVPTCTVPTGRAARRQGRRRHRGRAPDPGAAAARSCRAPAFWARRPGASPAGRASRSGSWIRTTGRATTCAGRRGSAVSIALLRRRPATARRRLRLLVSRRRRGPVRLGRGLRSGDAKRPAGRAAAGPRARAARRGAGVERRGRRSRRATRPASRPPASAACPASRIAWRWWRRARRPRRCRSIRPRPGTTPPGHALLTGAGAVAGRRAGPRGELRARRREPLRLRLRGTPARRGAAARAAVARRSAARRPASARAPPMRLVKGQLRPRRRPARPRPGRAPRAGRGRQPRRARGVRERRPRSRPASRMARGSSSDGGRWSLLAGQPTDDSEMALALARSIVEHDGFERDAVLDAYRGWLRSSPFDVGETVGRRAARPPEPREPGQRLADASEPARRLRPRLEPRLAAELARQDASLTHPSPVCGDATAAFVVALAHAVRSGGRGRGRVARRPWSGPRRAAPRSWCARRSRRRAASRRSATRAPLAGSGSRSRTLSTSCCTRRAWRRASWPRSGAAATPTRTRAVAGALLGAVHGRDADPGAVALDGAELPAARAARRAATARALLARGRAGDRGAPADRRRPRRESEGGKR